MLTYGLLQVNSTSVKLTHYNHVSGFMKSLSGPISIVAVCTHTNCIPLHEFMCISGEGYFKIWPEAIFEFITV